MNRRFFLASAGALASAPALAEPRPSDLLGALGEPYFLDWLNGFYGRATAAGLPRNLLDRELSGLSPDPRVTVLDARQPEFARPVSDYVKGAISEARITMGRTRGAGVAAFPAIERAHGVPREVLIAIWAMESGYGVQQGDMDVIRCLATLAAGGRRRDWAEGELVAALRMIAAGDVSRSRLRGSWAGAMGQTQVLPSVYLSTGVTPTGSRRPDVWGSAGDALATAANLLEKAGWLRGEGWTVEVKLPVGFDYGLSEGPKEPWAWWRGKNVRRADGRPWSVADENAPGILLLPSGAAGPAFLALPNHYAIRAYNNSIAYALATGFLADRLAGRQGPVTPWPHETALSLTQRVGAQSDLTRLGYNPGLADGQIGGGTRAALRAWQKAHGMIADGYLSPEMVERLHAAARRT